MVKQNPNSIFSQVGAACRHPITTTKVLSEWVTEYQKDIDRESLSRTLRDITNADRDRVDAVLSEAEQFARTEYSQQLSKVLPKVSSANLYRYIVGDIKYARADRVMLFCLARLLEPDIVLETGVKWGESSFFITEALRRNETGRLISIDIGFEESKEYYQFPEVADDVGFLVPESHAPLWDLRIGDSLNVLDQLLPTTNSIDVFYHDSLHTYEHMMGEFERVHPHMAANGLFMSEDIDINQAWDDFLVDNSDRIQSSHRYYSLPGISESREIGAALVK